MSRHFLLVPAVLATLAFPAAGFAQWGSTVPGEDARIEDALRLEARAHALEASPSTWDGAARLYRRAAGLRPLGDPLTVEHRRRAGFLAYYRGLFAEALTDFRAAARTAHDTGDVVSAVQDYVNAAWAAARLGNASEAGMLLASARKLTLSPLLSAAQREEALMRVSPASVASPDR